MILPHVVLVTGKGGTGKSSVAAALAFALARHRKVVLADLGQRPTTAWLLGDNQEGGGNHSTIDRLEIRSYAPRRELESFIERIVPLKLISRRMLRSHTFAYVTAALPGLEAFLMLERLRQLADEAAACHGFAVIDGPSSGGTLELLSVLKGVQDLAPKGTLNRLAHTIGDFLRDASRFSVWLTMRPERLAIREALETFTQLGNLGIGCITGVLNAIPDPLLSHADCLKIQHLDAHRRLAIQRNAICELASDAHKQFEAVGLNLIDLPMLYTPEFGRPQLEILAGALGAGVLANDRPN